MIFAPIQNEFEKRIHNNTSNENALLDLQYLHYILTCIRLGCCYNETTYLLNLKLPKSYAQEGRKQVILQKLLNADTIAVLYNPEGEEKITEKILQNTNDCIIITNYYLKEIFARDKVLEKTRIHGRWSTPLFLCKKGKRRCICS